MVDVHTHEYGSLSNQFDFQQNFVVYQHKHILKNRLETCKLFEKDKSAFLNSFKLYSTKLDQRINTNNTHNCPTGTVFFNIG